MCAAVAAFFVFFDVVRNEFLIDCIDNDELF